MIYFYNFIWEKGPREKNEDSLCIRQADKNGTDYLLAVVCDGIGGLEEGEHASSFVANNVSEGFMKMVKSNRHMTEREICNLVRRLVYQCHKALQRYGKENRIRLGTTLSMILMVNRKGYIFHVGDSSVFAGRKCLKRLTPIQQNKKGALLQAIGTGNNPVLFCKKIRLRKEMVILLASDGFYKKSEHEICREAWLKRLGCDEKRIGKALLAVKENVQALGEKDNISAICIKVG